MKNLIVISNDEFFFGKNLLYTKYNDTINILDAIQKKFKIFLIARTLKKKNNFFLINKKITKLSLIKTLRLKKLSQFKIFMISLTPRNFFFLLILKFFFGKVNGHILLRSNGSEEYRRKIGNFGAHIYNLMLNITKKNLKIISVSKKIYPVKKKYLIRPSEIDHLWLTNKTKKKNKIPKLLYLGRFRVEKGIYSLIKIFNKVKINYSLTIAGDNKKIKIKNNSITLLKEISDKKKLIKLFDNHDIFILPSYTEGYPKVILESIARHKPIIIFEDIKHVKNFVGIFVCKRNHLSISKMIDFIFHNYKRIQLKMRTNVLPLKSQFQDNLLKILYE